MIIEAIVLICEIPWKKDGLNLNAPFSRLSRQLKTNWGGNNTYNLFSKTNVFLIYSQKN
jgi:hypothetical protein